MLFVFITALICIILTGVTSILMWIIGKKNDLSAMEAINKNALYYLEMLRAIFAILGIVGALVSIVMI